MQLLGIPTDIPSYTPPTAWLRHGPFAMWLVRAMRPKRVVELGSHHGYSYFSFCQAVVAGNLSTECIAVDTWAGDEHAGYYDDSVFTKVKEHNEKYKTFSTLLRKTFAEALDDIPDASVDILHVDGRHFYNDVREDFESWIPKLSNRAVVLFHDTEVHERDFGVWRYWSELSQQRPSLNFPYQHGLGVLFWGKEIAEGLAPLVSLVGSSESRSVVAACFEALGETFAQRVANAELATALNTSIDDLNSNLLELQAAQAELKFELRAARRNPLQQLKRKIEFKVLRVLAKSSPPLSSRVAERLRRSATKRDPNRDDFQHANP